MTRANDAAIASIITRRSHLARTSAGSAAVIDPVLKPAKYAVDASKVAAAFNPLWTNLEFCFPMWDGSGNPVNVGSRGGSLTLGSGHSYHNVSGDGDTIDVPNSNSAISSVNMSGTPANRTTFAVVTIVTMPGGTAYAQLFGMGGGGTWLCDVGFNSEGRLLFYEVTGSGQQLISATGVVAVGSRYAIAAVADNSGGMRIHVGGAQVTSNATTGFLNNFGTPSVAMNIANSPFGGTGHRYYMHMAGYLTRALTVAEANLFTSDPYGLIRPA